MPRQKSNKVEHQKHVDECVDMVIKMGIGWTTWIDYCKEKYGISKNAANNIWKQAWGEIEKLTDRKNMIKVESLVTRLEQLYQDGDDNVKLKAIEQLRKIGGIDASDRMEITHNGEIKFNFGSPIPVKPKRTDLGPGL